MRKIIIHNEIELMESFRQGSNDSFSIIFHQLFPSLCFYALKITNNQETAEDIAEETLIKVWERREIFYQMKVLKSYLYTTVRHTSINWSKQQRYHRSVKKEISYLSTENDGHVLADIIKGEMISQLTKAKALIKLKNYLITSLCIFFFMPALIKDSPDMELVFFTGNFINCIGYMYRIGLRPGNRTDKQECNNSHERLIIVVTIQTTSLDKRISKRRNYFCLLNINLFAFSISSWLIVWPMLS